MNSPPEPGSPSLSTPSSASPPPDEYFPQEAARTTDLLNMVASGLNSPSSSKRRPFGGSSARESKSRRREGPSRGAGSAATWDKDTGGSSRKEDMIDNSAVDFLRKALQLSNEQRNAYGLRYHDFARYRKHCANRTHRIRSTLKMTHGKGREFKKLPSLKPEMIKDGHLQLLLMESERAWAYSQDLLAQSQKNTEHATTLRHSATGRFRRSTLYASSRLSAEGLLEVTVYTLILNGRFLRYREEFDDALVQLGVARHLLDELAGAARTSRDQALATLFGDEIGPEIRYCAHELGRAEAYNVDKIVAEVAATNRNVLVGGCDALLEAFKKQEESTNKRKTLQEIVWEGEPVPVRNPELLDVFLKVQDAQAKLESSDAQGKSNSKKSVAAYDAILLALSDAEEVAKKLADAQTSSGPRDISFVHAYIVYQLLSRRIQRDLRLMQALLPMTKGATDGRVYPAVVKLLDTVMQSLTQCAL
ncbi:hypothetical protein CPB85DRAFT_1442941 [Mucidula mucida]|nr:hypothetical protein CPB85DRAFT_1442941 [Mucidula mucida]